MPVSEPSGLSGSPILICVGIDVGVSDGFIVDGYPVGDGVVAVGDGVVAVGDGVVAVGDGVLSSSSVGFGVDEDVGDGVVAIGEGVVGVGETGVGEDEAVALGSKTKNGG